MKALLLIGWTLLSLEGYALATHPMGVLAVAVWGMALVCLLAGTVGVAMQPIAARVSR